MPIPAEALRATDGDSDPEDLVYTLERPSNGRVVLRAAPDTEVRSFTQAQLDSGLVIFSHTGSLHGGFRFNLSDGEHWSPGHLFRVTAQTPALLSLEGTRALTVCPGSVQTLGSQILKASSSLGSEPGRLLYRVLRGPRLGRLLRGLQDPGEALHNFTQAEVDADQVLYEHEMPLEPFWEAQDTLELQLSSPPAPDVATTLSVTVSFDAPCPQRPSRLWKNTGLWVPEGQRVEVTTAALDASNFLASVEAAQRPGLDVLFQVTQFPTRGRLLLSGAPLHAGQPSFLQSQLVAGQLEYAHSGGGAQPDAFRFRAHLQDPRGAWPAGPRTSEAFALSVRAAAKDEWAPRPHSSAPLRLRRGSRAPVSRAQLSLQEPAPAPADVRYEVRRAPRNGFLTLAGGSPGPVHSFTQADVDAGRLAFTANGSSVAGTFQLSVAVGAGPPAPVALIVDVLPAALEVRPRAPLEVAQAAGRGLLSRRQLLAVSDREELDAEYRLTRVPRHGQLLVRGQSVTAFSQLQVDQGEVAFVFTNFSSPHDNFGVLALARGLNASATVDVKVKALLRLWTGGPWPQGATLLLDPAIMDASELANRTGSVPHFRLLEGPRRGRLVHVPKVGTDPVKLFTQQDLEAGRLGLELGTPQGTTPGPTSDNLTLELWAQGVPPAVATLDFSTEPYNVARPYDVTLLSLPGTARTDRGAMGNSNPTGEPGRVAPSPVPTAARGGFLGFLEAHMFSVILPVCLVLLLLALLLPLIFYLRKRNKTGKHHVQMLAAKPRNGLASEAETFRKVEPGQTIPLTTMPGQGAPGSQPDPELLQFCRTSNPALKNGQYWV